MSAVPEASIVVPSYRGVSRLPALLNSLASQEDGTPPFEIIVVIDGAEDGSSELLEAEERLEVRSIQFSENRGRVAALNAGFNAARGDVLIRCDDDLVVPPGYAAAHIRAHEGQQPHGVVAPTRDVHAASPYARAYGEDAAARSLAHARSRPARELWRLWAASCSITRETWERIGPYDSRYQGYGWEDVDYGYRLHTAGIPIVLLNTALAEHRGPARSAQARALKAFEAGASRTIFRTIHPEAPVEEPLPGHGLWGAGVNVAARMLTSERAAARWGAVVDRALPIVPTAVGRKLTALAVEGSGLAGSRSSSTIGEEH
ncbi:glycosyltransferase family 2 protein [Microbacterium sp.]|uniref:glycosyltransferase family 2 protein n=1 Tax=Microbacterium sp. TaxID=51671 RepID=UPI003F957BE4